MMQHYVEKQNQDQDDAALFAYLEKRSTGQVKRCDSRASTASLSSMSSLFEDVGSVANSIFDLLPLSKESRVEVESSDSVKVKRRSSSDSLTSFFGRIALTPAADESPFQTAVRECPSRKGNAIYRLGRKAADCEEFAKAVHYYHIALVKQRSYYGKDHLKTAETLNFLGLALIELGELYGAIVALEESLYIRQKILGPGAEECVTTTTNISLVLDAQKRSLNT
jgi:tetratricopeptide (TPR) repeat protein